MMERTTPKSLQAQLDAVDRLLTAKQVEAEQGALAAVENPEKAEALSVVLTEIRHMKDDRDVIEAALSAAVERAHQDAITGEAQRRAEARAAAAVYAADTMAKAARVDALTADLVAALADLQAAEDATRERARAAGDILTSTRVGQRDAVGHALGNLQRIASGNRTGTPRSAADICRAGWSELLETSDSREVA